MKSKQRLESCLSEDLDPVEQVVEEALIKTPKKHVRKIH